MAGIKIKKVSRSEIIHSICWILVLSILPFVIFRPETQIEPVQKTQKRFTFMTSTPLVEDDQHGLTYWEKSGNPQLFAKPDSQYGFSAFLTPEINYAQPVGESMDQLPALPGVFSPGKLEVRKERVLHELLPWIDVPLMAVKPPRQIFMANAPVFLLEDGTILPIDGFQQPESNVKDLQPTLLRVVNRSQNSPPEISVMRSCGDSQLDAAAMRALFFPAVVDQRITGTIRVEWKSGNIK